MSEARRALLEWVVHEDQVVHVSTFAHLSKEDLPPVVCPVCGEEVILKRGTKRAHHYAHYPKSICAATAPESATHLNVKFYLAEVLEASRKLSVVVDCAYREISVDGPRDLECPGSRVVPLAKEWDEVLVERRLTSLRPDLLLVKGGEPLAAVEVHHTNAVSKNKAGRLAELDLKWVEVAADSDLFRADGWTPDDPMPVERMQPGEPWVCDYHLEHRARERALEERRVQQAKRQAKRENERQRLIAECRTLFWRIVDLYGPTGRVARRLYRARGWFPDGAEKAKRIWIESFPDGSVFFHSVDNPRGRRSWVELQEHFDKHLEDLNQRGFTIDSPMDWLEHEDFASKQPVGYQAFPMRCQWDAEQESWRRMDRLADTT